jgi:hypothetical protein
MNTFVDIEGCICCYEDQVSTPDLCDSPLELAMNILTKRCECEPLMAERISRRPWMRLLPGVRAYVCTTCGERFLASKNVVEAAKITQRLNNFSGQTTNV